MAFAESMTEPPPTARIQSTLASLQRRTPSRTRVISGFGRTPPSSKCSMPAASSDAPTRSISPEATALPPPKCTSTRLAPAAVSFSPTCSSAPRPKTKCVGETNSKFSMGVLSAFRHGDALSLSPHHRRRARSPIILCVDARASPANRQLSDRGKCLAIFANKAACHKIALRPPHGQVGYSPWVRVMRSAISVAVLAAMLA